MHIHQQKAWQVPTMKPTLSAKKLQRLLAAAAIITLLLMALRFTISAQALTEYERYVHTYTDNASLGNWTYLEKPLFPVYLNTSQIPIGENWTVVCPLSAGHSYHVYCYGGWVHTGPEPKTDYDIYVYNPSGELESTHTEAAGLPEHLGTTVDDPYFVPAHDGNYTFVVVNDARESHGAEQATFMIIEHIDCDVWYTHDVEGKNGTLANFDTSWSYEFMTDSPRIELYVQVPDTLDMYEARLYLMSDAQSPTVNNVSLPWEMGLYGNLTGDVGGYNLEDEGYRGVAYASCEFNGQDMYLNYTTTTEGPRVYHLVLMGEVGSGTIDFLVKTTFGGTLTPLTNPGRVYPTNQTLISYEANSTELEDAALKYTVDDWMNVTTLPMAVSNMTCNATIPQQQAGAVVQYAVNAVDAVKNNLTATGNFTVKYASSITDFNTTTPTVTLGGNITATGTLSREAAVGNASVTVQFMSTNDTITVTCKALENGTFTASFQPETAGVYTAQATFTGSGTVYECDSPIAQVTVEEPSFLAQNGIFIGGGVGGGLAAVGAVVYVKKYRQ
jgi:hypothetical protein